MKFNWRMVIYAFINYPIGLKSCILYKPLQVLLICNR